ncbi:unnamed protein product, partial [Closterium sp. Naga37s-1]
VVSGTNRGRRLLSSVDCNVRPMMEMVRAATLNRKPQTLSHQPFVLLQLPSLPLPPQCLLPSHFALLSSASFPIPSLIPPPYIVSGTNRGRRLLSPADRNVRPMMEMMRAAVFDMLHALLDAPHRLPPGSRWLDLYSGTGSWHEELGAGGHEPRVRAGEGNEALGGTGAWHGQHWQACNSRWLDLYSGTGSVVRAGEGRSTREPPPLSLALTLFPPPSPSQAHFVEMDGPMCRIDCAGLQH